MADDVGKLGKYALKRRLGKGGMGEVWLGHDPDLGIDVAIKTLPPHLAEEDPRYVDRFKKEARTAAQISHPNMVSLYSIGEDDGVHFMVMEYIDGPTIKELLETHGAMQPTAALKIVHKVALALQAAAKYNIIHRDIKPDNVMTNSFGKVKLCDLGLAKQTGEGKKLTLDGASFGTPAYISPEQAEDSSSVDHRADVYSLGAMLYHMITGVRPFDAPSPVAMMLAHISDPLPHPTEKQADLPDNVCSLVCKMMAKDRDERYQSASELLEDIVRILQDDAPAAKLHCRDYSQKSVGPGKSSSSRTFKVSSRGNRSPGSKSEESTVVSPSRPKKSPVDLVLAIIACILLIVFVVLVMHHRANKQSEDGSSGTGTMIGSWRGGMTQAVVPDGYLSRERWAGGRARILKFRVDTLVKV